MRKIIFLLLLIVLIPVNVFAQEKKTAILFYADWCPHCQKVEAYLKQQGFFEKYDITQLNFDEPVNKIKLNKMLAEKQYAGEAGIPAIFIDGQVFTGDKDIIAYFEKQLSPKTAADNEDIITPDNGLIGRFTIFALIGAAFLDASNPCALAVLILLLATVIAAKGKKHALLSGLMFSLAIFLSYLLMGVGIYRAIAVFNISKYLSLGVGVLAILIALANFKDVFWYGKFFIMEVPLSWRPKMQEIIKKATGPWSAFGIGFLRASDAAHHGWNVFFQHQSWQVGKMAQRQSATAARPCWRYYVSSGGIFDLFETIILFSLQNIAPLLLSVSLCII